MGIEFRFETKVRSAIRKGATFLVKAELDGKSESFEADFILNATGRTPSIEKLSLDRANVEVTSKGVIVDDYLRSKSNPLVFEAGDAHGRFQLSPVAAREGKVAAINFLRGNTEKLFYDAIPRVVYTIPELASVGMAEEEAISRGIQYQVAESDMADWKVYRIRGEEVAQIKLIIDSHSDKILGAHILGALSSEIIHVFSLAIEFGITAKQLENSVYAYPTLTSALSSALGEVKSAVSVALDKSA